MKIRHTLDMIIRHFIFAGALLIGLSGCVSTEQAQTAPSTPTVPIETAAKKGDIIFNYRANGADYKIHARYDRLLRAYGLELIRLSGAPFTGASSEDKEAQNTIRDAFLSRKICKGGLYPGILQWNYGYIAERGVWGAKVRCTKEKQKNI